MIIATVLDKRTFFLHPSTLFRAEQCIVGVLVAWHGTIRGPSVHFAHESSTHVVNSCSVCRSSSLSQHGGSFRASTSLGGGGVGVGWGGRGGVRSSGVWWRQYLLFFLRLVITVRFWRTHMLSGLSRLRTVAQICSQWSRSLNKVPYNFTTPGVASAHLTARFQVFTPAVVACPSLNPISAAPFSLQCTLIRRMNILAYFLP